MSQLEVEFHRSVVFRSLLKGKRKCCIDNRLDACCRARLTSLHVVGGRGLEEGFWPGRSLRASGASGTYH